MQYPQQSAWAPAPTYPAPGPAYPAPPYPMPPAPTYEFTPEHNAVIGRTATRMRAVGIVSIVLGALQTLGALIVISKSPVGIIQLPPAIVLVVCGLFFTAGGGRLHAVVKTQGDDVGHLMDALRSVGNAFLVQIIAVIVVVGLALLAAVASAF
jgi:hypothetical protein